MEANKKKQVAKISVFITSVFVIFLSITYAFINMTVTGTKRQVITSGNLQVELEEDNAITLESAMPMYDEVGMIQDAFNFRLVNKTSEDTNYIVKLVDITDASKEKLDTSIVKYGLTKDGVSTINLLSTLTDNQLDSGKISGNQTIHYSLRLWIDSTVTDNDAIKDKMLSYRIDVEVRQDGYIVQSIVFDTAVANLGESCKTYDDGTDTFLVGRCQNNYVWYSGKLWRVVLKNNETGAVKLVTDNAISAIENLNFENNYIDQWLNQEFLPTLHDYKNYLLVDSTWLITNWYGDNITQNRTVGLLNDYEYYTTYEKSDGLATRATNYLNIGVWWWLNTIQQSVNAEVQPGGETSSEVMHYGLGIRPSVNLKPMIEITSGDGTKEKPYRLQGDEQETINGATLVNTRYSGEYVRFNSELYRIVGVENNLTKIIAVDKPSTLSSNQFHIANGTVNFGEASIKADLENYYQELDETTRIMIEPNTTWYLGSVALEKNYKASICAVFDEKTDTKTCEKTTTTTTANIGLPRYGEMFASQITRGTKTAFWILTPYADSNARFMRYEGDLTQSSNLTGTYGVRPSMYLKSNVVIASTNTGDGTYEHPYDIELKD